jgi:hypothetical protein
MSNILVITGNLKDWSKNSGGKERTATLIEALAEAGNSVTLLSLSWEGPSFEKQVSKNIYQIQPGIEYNVLRRYKKLITNRLKNNYDLAIKILQPELKEFNRQVKLLSKEADLIVLDHFSAAPFIENISHVPIVYNSHNSEITMAKQLYPENEYAIQILTEMEYSAISKSALTTYCSKEDFKNLIRHYGLEIDGEYVPNGSKYYSDINYEARSDSKDILFVGSGHLPNVLAAKELIPLAKIMPEYNFIIAGDAGKNINKNLAPENIKVLGHVSHEELDNLFLNCFAFINPMKSGSGTHLKMMKALGFGIPIVTSRFGARGFEENEIDSSMLIAEDTEGLKLAIQKLENKKYHLEISKNSHQTGKSYDWEVIKTNYVSSVSKLIKTSTKANINPSEIINKEKVLVYSIIRNRSRYMEAFYSQLKKLVQTYPQYEFYLSIYENDSTDSTKEKIFNKDWSFFSGVSITSENLNTQYFTSTKDEERVKNLAIARNKALESNPFLPIVDYVLMTEGDIRFKVSEIGELLSFKEKEPDFDIVSAISIRKNGTHYDWWATRTSAKFVKDHSEIEDNYNKKDYGRYYSTSNGLCLYRAKPFQEGVRHHWINTVTKEPDCEMVVLCQNFQEKGYKNIFINYKVKAYHEC